MVNQRESIEERPAACRDHGEQIVSLDSRAAGVNEV